SIAAKNLNTVIVPGIMGSRDDHTCCEAVFAGEIRDCRGGDDTRILNGRARFGKSSGKDGGDPGAGLASIHSEDHGGVGRGVFELVREGESHGVDGLWVERRLTGYSANSIGSEECSHASFFLGSCLIFVMRLSRVPLAR